MGIIQSLYKSWYSDIVSECSDDDDELQEQQLLQEIMSSKRNITFDSVTEVNNSNDISMDSNKFDFDGSLGASSSTLQSGHIELSLENLKDMENCLEFYEKLSLVYLLYDYVDIALQDLELILKGTTKDLLYNWGRQEDLKGHLWKQKIIEAMCIIQNYEVLRKYGYKKQELIARFLPTSEYVACYINKYRKVMYIFCERLKLNQLQEFLQLIRIDFKKKKLNFKSYDPQYREMYLLHWESLQYISTKPTAVDVLNIKCIFKEIGLEHICDLLNLCSISTDRSKQKIDTNLNEQQKDTTTRGSNMLAMESQLSGNSRFNITDTDVIEDQSFCSEMQINSEKSPEDEDYYEIDPLKPGICLIINQVKFYRDFREKYRNLLPDIKEPLADRTGTEFDRDTLVNTFEEFGFQVIIKENLIHDEVIEAISDVTKKVINQSSLFVCILSHGNEGVIYGVNSLPVSVEEIKSVICSTNYSNLLGKPKVLILQSCQGAQCQKLPTLVIENEDDLTHDGPALPKRAAVAPTADLLVFWATISGFGAIRNKKSGSWFIQSLCSNMIKLNKKRIHFEDICRHTMREVGSMQWKKDNDIMVMIPQRDSTFTKAFYLPSIKTESDEKKILPVKEIAKQMDIIQLENRYLKLLLEEMQEKSSILMNYNKLLLHSMAMNGKLVIKKK